MSNYQTLFIFTLFTENIKKKSNYICIYTCIPFVYVRYTSNKLHIPIYNDKSVYLIV